VTSNVGLNPARELDERLGFRRLAEVQMSDFRAGNDSIRLGDQLERLVCTRMAVLAPAESSFFTRLRAILPSDDQELNAREHASVEAYVRENPIFNRRFE